MSHGTDSETLEEQCAKKGMRMTEQRRVIAQVIEAAADHPDVEELLPPRLGDRPASISLSTVYRTVNLFEEAGLVTKHDFKDGRARFEPIPDEHHDHLIDIRSGKVIEFRNEEIEAIQEADRQAPRLPAGRPPARALRRAAQARGRQVIFRTLFFIFIYLPMMLIGIPLQFIITRLGLVLELPHRAVPSHAAASSSASGSRHRRAAARPADAAALQPHLVDRHHRHRLGGRRDLRRQDSNT